MKVSSCVLIVSLLVAPLLGLGGLWVLLSSQSKTPETKEFQNQIQPRNPAPTPQVF